uniref:Transcription factor TCP8 n=1 Tax=Anthurium amnicola TaxID=1678845 RepID=A0A1D1Z1X6_9ARAE
MAMAAAAGAAARLDLDGRTIAPMTICMIGAGGFIGSHLCEKLMAETPHIVLAVDVYNDKIRHLLEPETAAAAAAHHHHHRANYEDGATDPGNILHPAAIFGFPQQLHQHHQNQMGDGLHAADATAAGDSADAYLRKRYREDLFKDDQQEPPPPQQPDGRVGGGGRPPPSSPTSGSAKSPRVGNGGHDLQQQHHRPQHHQDPAAITTAGAAAAAAAGLIRPSNVVPAAAMWAVAAAPAPTSGGGAIWMLPVNTAGFNTPTVAAAAAAAGPSEPSTLWTFPTAAGQYRSAVPVGGGGAGGTIPAPLQFMSRINFSGGLGAALPLGSMLQPSPQPGAGAASSSQQYLGMGISETNLGMLAALNAYSKAGLRAAAEQNHPLDHHEVQQQQQQGDDDDDHHQTSSQ